MRSRKHFSIFVGNGLGNQLFVYAYIFNLIEKNSPNHITINILFTRNPREWTPYYLEDLVGLTNARIRFRKAKGIKYFFRVRLFKAISKLMNRPKAMLAFFRIYHEDKVFIFYSKFISIKSYSIVFGSFISNKYVQPVWHLIEPNLLKWLELKKFPEKVEELSREECVVLHVRRGDTVKMDPSKSRGIIGKNYYETCLNEIIKNDTVVSPRKILVITDDLVSAKNDLSGLRIDHWLGPEELDAIGALKLMTKARYFVGCNSTLSWWGAQILINSKHCDAFLPKPWYAQTVEEIEISMFIEGARYIESGIGSEFN